MTKGLILAGAVTRLYPITKVINKHLIPIGKTPMIYHPIRTVVGSGIDQIPSGRDEYEVTDLINEYIQLGGCDSHVLSGSWLDAGTFESLRKALEIFGE